MVGETNVKVCIQTDPIRVDLTEPLFVRSKGIEPLRPEGQRMVIVMC